MKQIVTLLLISLLSTSSHAAAYEVVGAPALELQAPASAQSNIPAPAVSENRARLDELLSNYGNQDPRATPAPAPLLDLVDFL